VKTLVVSVTAFVLVSVAAVIFVVHWNGSALAIDEPLTVSVEPGESFVRFAERLTSAGILSHPRMWSRLARLRGLARRVKAGEYLIEPTDTPETLLQRLVAGTVVSYQIRINEGWTIMQSLQTFASHDKLKHTLRGVDVETLLDALGLPAGHAEGLFFPDTYRFVGGDSDADILRRAYAKMSTELEAAWSQRQANVPYETPYQVLIVASLVEKETGREEDREHVSQVFASRLREGMRLQTDPTVIYGMGERFDGNLRRRDLKEDTPYNTYVHRGLPPTPIALPGARSIHAALHPGSGNFLYFVSRGDGSSQFSMNLADHRAAVRRYQLQ
jgi:UPF0755 protein